MEIADFLVGQVGRAEGTKRVRLAPNIAGHVDVSDPARLVGFEIDDFSSLLPGTDPEVLANMFGQNLAVQLTDLWTQMAGAARPVEPEDAVALRRSLEDGRTRMEVPGLEGPAPERET